MNTEIFNKFRIASFLSSGLLILWFYFGVDFSKVKFISELGINSPRAIPIVLGGFITFCTIECLVELSKIKQRAWQYYYQVSTLIGVSLISSIIAYPKIASTFLLLETSRFDIIIPLSFSFLASIFASMLMRFLIVAMVFIKFRKTIFISQVVTFCVLVSLIAMSTSAIYYVDAISNSTSLIVRNIIFVIFFIVFLLAQSPKEPIFSKERLEWLKKKSDSLDHQVEVHDLSKSSMVEDLVYPEKKLSKKIRSVIKRSYERNTNSVFPRYITLQEIPFEIKNGHLFPEKGVLNNDDFVIEVNVIKRSDGSVRRSEKIMFKYVLMACEKDPVKVPKSNDAGFITSIAENAWKLQLLDQNDPSDLMVRMAESDGNLPEIKALFKNKKVDVNFIALNGWTALLSSVANSAEKTAKYLLQKAADPCLSNKHDVSPLHFASKYGNVSLCRLLVDYKANINQVDIWGATPLMMASKHGHSAIVKMFIENNASTTIKDSDNETAYTYAVKGNHGGIVRYMKKNNME